MTRTVSRTLAVLMVDFSCALKLAMPLAVLSAMREASAFHITVKGGKYLEKTALADTVVFDKAGTLTHACPVVAEVIPFGRQDETEMLRLAVCLEEHFPQSMANAVVRAARERGLDHEEMHSQVEYLVAHGIASTVNKERVVIGFNGSLIALGALGVLPPATSATLHNLSTLGISLRSMTNLLEPNESSRLFRMGRGGFFRKGAAGYPCSVRFCSVTSLIRS